MATVRFKRLSLSGFGPYRETVEFTFTDHLNVLVAPNETGKSTLVAGIVALIFGIPQTTDVTVFGQARFRNWDHPLRFEGEVICESSGETFRIRRDFNSNQVSLAKREGEEYREIVSGTHNPRAQRRNLRYEEKIRDLFGLNSQEIFEATFCLTQPLPEGSEIDGRVQELLSGTGAVFHQATERLTEELRTITRFTGRLGVTTRDAIDPRELELLEEKIEEIKQEIKRDQEIVDRLEALRRSLAEQENSRGREGRALSEKERLVALWGDWKRLRESYHTARSVYSQSKQVTVQAEELSTELKRVDQEKASFPWGPSLPLETAEMISELLSIQEQRRRLIEKIEELESQVTETFENESSLKASEEREENEEIEWGVFGAGPASVVKGLAREAKEALVDWETIQQASSTYQECQAILEEEFALFSDVDQETVSVLKSYPDRRAWLYSALESASLKLEKSKGALKRAERYGKLRKALIFFSTVISGMAAILLRIEGGGRFFATALSLFIGAGLGYSLGRVLFPVGSLSLLRERVVEDEESVKQALIEIEGFKKQVGLFERQYTDLPAACQRWEKFQAKQEEALQRIQDFLNKQLGGFSGEMEDCSFDEVGSKIAARWLELRELARVTSPYERFQRLGELVEWLRGKTPKWWELLIDEAGEYEERVRRMTEIKARNLANQGYLAKQREELNVLKRREEILAGKLSGLLDHSGGDYDKAKRLWELWHGLEIKAEKIRESIRNILATQGVDSLEKLGEKTDDASLRAQALYNEWKKLIDDHPGLTGIDEATDLEMVEKDHHRLQEEVEEGKKALDRVMEAIRHLQIEIGRIEGQEPINIAAAELRLREMEERRVELERMSAALTLAYQEMAAAISDFQNTHRLMLAKVTSEYFRAFTGSSSRGVEIDEDFRVAVNIDGQSVVPAQLSHGAQDQLYIALRLGIAHLLAEEMILPFVFDDPFLNCDQDRLASIRSSLSSLSTERQIILLSHRDDFLSWGEAVGVVNKARIR